MLGKKKNSEQERKYHREKIYIVIYRKRYPKSQPTGMTTKETTSTKTSMACKTMRTLFSIDLPFSDY